MVEDSVAVKEEGAGELSIDELTVVMVVDDDEEEVG